MVGYLELITPAISFILTLILTPLVMKLMWKIGKRAYDIHKPNKPMIPDMGGVAVILSTTIVIILLFLIKGINTKLLATLVAALFAGFVGLIDDIVNLGKYKPLYVLPAVIPFYILNAYNPRPPLPLIPKTRLTIIYPILLPLAIAVPANAVNMLDAFNGITPLTMIPVFLALSISSILNNRGIEIPALIIACSLLAFLYYNKYPAKTFMGNAGDMFIGGIAGALMVAGSLEVVGITAMMPHIINGFQTLASLRGLAERREVPRPTVIEPDGKLKVSDNLRAPITLVSLLLLDGPMKEKEIISEIFKLSLFSFILAIITGVLVGIKI